jgi:hypothetical protein
LARHPGTALIALVHALALVSFFEHSEGSCLEIAPKSAWLSGYAPGIDESLAEKQIAERQASWAKRLPQEPEGLWTFVRELADTERLELLAHCVSLTANAIRAPRQRSEDSEAHAALLATEVGLDMTAYWQPTATGYFGRVSKERHLSGRARNPVRSGCREHRAHEEAGDGRCRGRRSGRKGLAPRSATAESSPGVNAAADGRAAQAALFFSCGCSARDGVALTALPLPGQARV